MIFLFKNVFNHIIKNIRQVLFTFRTVKNTMVHNSYIVKKQIYVKSSRLRRKRRRRKSRKKRRTTIKMKKCGKYCGCKKCAYKF